MSRGLTESEWRRIEEFASTPGHRRSPEMLLPEDREFDREEGDDAAQ